MACWLVRIVISPSRSKKNRTWQTKGIPQPLRKNGDNHGFRTHPSINQSRPGACKQARLESGRRVQGSFGRVEKNAGQGPSTLNPPDGPNDQQRRRLTLTELLEGHEEMVRFSETDEAKAWESARPVGREVPVDEDSSE